MLLLLVTGIGANLDMWQPFVGLIRDREVIAFDPPGAGGSQRPRRPLRMGGLAAVVESLLDELGLGVVDVLGDRSAAASHRSWPAVHRSASAD